MFKYQKQSVPVSEKECAYKEGEEQWPPSMDKRGPTGGNQEEKKIVAPSLRWRSHGRVQNSGQECEEHDKKKAKRQFKKKLAEVGNKNKKPFYGYVKKRTKSRQTVEGRR